MNRTLQSLLLAFYRLIKATGLLATPPGRYLFERAYNAYKTLLEAGPVEQLRPFVRGGAWVVDVGANVGFFTTRFGSWISGHARVLAIEPEELNCRRLAGAVARAGLAEKVEIVQGVATDTDGTAPLRINPHHPGDHRMGSGGVPVAAHRLDTLLTRLGEPDISLIKIDVQGAEEKVLDGAETTLARTRPALFVEVHDTALRDFGSSAEQLLQRLADMGYRLHLLERGGISSPLNVTQALARLGPADDYLDFLCLPDPDG